MALKKEQERIRKNGIFPIYGILPYPAKAFLSFLYPFSPYIKTPHFHGIPQNPP
jgi:hypothetical protein